MFRMFAMDEWVTGASRVGDWFALWGPVIGRGLTAAVLVWVAIRLAAREGHFPVAPAPSCGCPPFCHGREICRVPAAAGEDR